MKILTGNDLKTGAVTWWDGSNWSLDVNDALIADEHTDEIIIREKVALRVNAAYVIDGEQTPEGVRPLHIKERMRAVGPTIHPHFSLRPGDPEAFDWVIGRV